MASFTETYLKFNKATTFMAKNPDKRDSHQEPFIELCNQLDNSWRDANASQRNDWASELVSQVVNNKVLNYQLYGKSKEQWFGDPFKQ